MNKNMVRPKEYYDRVWRNPDMTQKKPHALSKYKEEYGKNAIDVLGKGKSYAALAASLDVSVDTIDNWRREYPEFEESCKIGRAKGQAWWEENSDENMHNKDFSSVRYIFKMKSQYQVRDGTEPVKQDAATNTHLVFGMDSDKHNDLIQRVLTENAKRGDTNE